MIGSRQVGTERPKSQNLQRSSPQPSHVKVFFFEFQGAEEEEEWKGGLQNELMQASTLYRTCVRLGTYVQHVAAICLCRLLTRGLTGHA